MFNEYVSLNKFRMFLLFDKDYFYSPSFVNIFIAVKIINICNKS